MSRRIQQGEFRVFIPQDSLLGEDGDAALALEPEIVEEGVFVVDSAELQQIARHVHHRFGKGSLSRVDMRQYPDDSLFHASSSFVPIFL